MKLLLLLLVVGIAFWMIVARRRGPRVPPPSNPSHPPAAPAPATMVACAHCGVHLPRPDALVDGDGGLYCSEAHRRAGPR